MLETLQMHFQTYLMQGNQNPILPNVRQDERFSASKRLKVYFDAYRIRLLDILKLDFPKTHTLMGDEVFDAAFYDYLAGFPSQHFSVRYFGQAFPLFLKSTKPFADNLVFAEMARFEWSITNTLDAKDAPLLTQRQLSSLPFEQWAKLCFTFHPSVGSEIFNGDVPQLWQEIEKEAPPRPPKAHPAPQRWLFWRKGLSSFFQSCLDVEENIFLAMQNQKPFGEICEGMLDLLPEEGIPVKVAQTLFKWIHEEMISSFYLSE